MTPSEFRAARQALGLSTIELASVLGVEPRTVRKWEAEVGSSNARDPNPVAARAVAWFMGGFRPPEWPFRPEGRVDDR